MRSHFTAFPFALIAASALGWHGCQPSSATNPKLGAVPAATSGTGAGAALTILYQNNANGEIEPCG